MTKSPEADSPGIDPVLAYRNKTFLESEAARPIRILSEYLYPLDALHRQHVRDTVVFFGSARIRETGPLARYYAEARELARRLTEWSESLASPGRRYIVCTGGGPGIMEAANRGAMEAGGRTIGLNIGLPHEQRPNQYLTPDLSFQFHYFFMRKLWFAHMAQAIVVFPGGFGTMDEMFEILTLSQTGKLSRKLLVLLYGSAYWNELVNFDTLVKHGMIDKTDLGLFRYVDTPDAALEELQQSLGSEKEPPSPAFHPSVTPENPDPRPRESPPVPGP
jgi:uncharacterized protein (TIGR00730 family)